jgi:ribosomal-protein-alanine N-acetyltransferase
VSEQSLRCASGIPAKLIKGLHISLTPVSMDGIKGFHEYSIHPEFYEHLEFPPFQTYEDSKRYLEELIYRSSFSEAQYWFIRLGDGHKVVGTICLHSLNVNRASVEIGYGVSPEYWGRGIFTTAGKMIMDYSFNELSIHRIVARTSVRNRASLRGLERLGFHTEGVMRDYYRCFTGEWIDAVLLSKLKTDK